MRCINWEVRIMCSTRSWKVIGMNPNICPISISKCGTKPLINRINSQFWGERCVSYTRPTQCKVCTQLIEITVKSPWCHNIRGSEACCYDVKHIPTLFTFKRITKLWPIQQQSCSHIQFLHCALSVCPIFLFLIMLICIIIF